MPLQTFQPVPFGNLPVALNNSLTLESASEKAAFIARIAKAGNIRKVRFYTSTVTTNEQLTVSLQNLDSNGDPDGTPDQSGTVTVSANSWNVVTLGSDRAVAVGDLLAVVIEYTAATGNMVINRLSALTDYGGYVSNNTGSWTRGTQAVCGALEYDDGTYAPIPGWLPAFIVSSGTFNTGTVIGSGGDERGNRFQVPFPARCFGLAAYVNTVTNAADWEAVLYADDGTLLASGAVDANNIQAINALSIVQQVPFTTPVTLAAHTWYRACIKATTANNIALVYHDLPAAAAMDMYIGGQNMYWCYRADAGSFTDLTTRRGMVAPILDRFDDGKTEIVVSHRRVR